MAASDIPRYPSTSVPVLSLSTVDEGIPISIDKKRYLLRHPDSLPIAQLRRIETLGPRIAGLLEVARPTKAQRAETSELLREFVSMVVEAPASVLDRLRDLHRVQVLEVFIKLRGPVPARGAKTVHPANRRRSAKRSRG